MDNQSSIDRSQDKAKKSLKAAGNSIANAAHEAGQAAKKQTNQTADDISRATS